MVGSGGGDGCNDLGVLAPKRFGSVGEVFGLAVLLFGADVSVGVCTIVRGCFVGVVVWVNTFLGVRRTGGAAALRPLDGLV